MNTYETKTEVKSWNNYPPLTNTPQKGGGRLLDLPCIQGQLLH